MTTVLDRGQDVDLGTDLGVGAGRIVAAPMTTSVPSDISDIIQTTTASNANEVQTLTITGTPTGGTFKLRFRGYETPVIDWDAAAADVQAALLAAGSIGSGMVTCGGGPLPGTPVTITFGGQLGNQNVNLITAVSIALTGGTTPTASVVTTTPGVGIYEVKNGWYEVGPTLGGITVSNNFTEQTYSIDQLNADIFSIPNGGEMSIAAAVSRIRLETMQMIWEAGSISTLASGNRHLTFGPPDVLTQRRAAIIYQRPSLDGGTTPGKIQVLYFRITQRSPQETSLVFQKESTQRAPAFTWKVLPDTFITDPKARWGGFFDEATN